MYSSKDQLAAESGPGDRVGGEEPEFLSRK